MSLEKPHIFREGEWRQEDIESFCRTHDIAETVDIYEQQFAEHVHITHPSLRQTAEHGVTRNEFFAKHINSSEGRGSWIYYPWSRRLVHMIGEREYRELRLNRNRDLITTSEYELLFGKHVAIVGLSIGSTIARVAAMTGVARTFTLVEYDTLESTNMNRLFGRVDQIGKPKINILTQQLYEFDPYLELRCFERPLTRETAQEISAAPGHPDIWIDAMDDIAMKIELRRVARDSHIPVLMVTSLGDSVLVDIERFDLEPTRPLFHDQLEDVIDEVDTATMSEEKKHEYAVRIVGRELVPQRALDSVKKIGTELVGRPQLMSTVSVAAGVASLIMRDVFLGKMQKSGRRHIRYEDFFSHLA